MEISFFFFINLLIWMLETSASYSLIGRRYIHFFLQRAALKSIHFELRLKSFTLVTSIICIISHYNTKTRQHNWLLLEKSMVSTFCPCPLWKGVRLTCARVHSPVFCITNTTNKTGKKTQQP